MAIVISVALGAILCVSQVQQWSKMTAGQRQTFDPTACSLFGVVFVGAVLLAALRGTGHDCRVRDRDDSVHLCRHAHQAAGTGSQGWGHCGVRVPGGAADYRGQLRSRPADLRRQASRSVLRSSRRPPSGGLRCPGGEPHCRHRGRDRRPHPTHRSSDHGTGAGHRGRRHARPAASGRPSSVRARDRTPGRRHGQPLGGTPEARHCRCGPRRLCRHRLGAASIRMSHRDA
jgi:hypothetical protein